MPRRRLALIAVLLAAACGPAESAGTTPAAAPTPPGLQTAVFAGGCFWSMEKNFEEVPGVTSVVSGFAGGRTANPTYEQVVRGGTGHLEAVQVTFDPARVSYRRLVDRFWRTIDPTDAQGQFCDRGASYGTAVFATEAQRPVAEASRVAAARQVRGTFVTPVRDAVRFWAAGAEHQDFWRRNPVRYAGYSRFCGRHARLAAIWGDQAEA